MFALSSSTEMGGANGFISFMSKVQGFYSPDKAAKDNI